MITEDFNITTEWLEIPLRNGGTYQCLVASNVNQRNVLYLVGEENTTSNGIAYNGKDMVKVDTTLKIKTDERYCQSAIVTIVRD